MLYIIAADYVFLIRIKKKSGRIINIISENESKLWRLPTLLQKRLPIKSLSEVKELAPEVYMLNVLLVY